MIDYDLFWAKPAAVIQPPTTHVPGLTPGPGRTEEQFADWEQAYGVRFPEVLRQAFARQDGGFVGENETWFRVLPLDEIDYVDEGFWEWARFEEEIADRDLVFEFANDGIGGRYFLAYAPAETDRDPAVFVFHGDTGDATRCSATVTEFFSEMLRTDECPAVDWAETAALAPIARETINLSPLFGGAPAEKEQILARAGGALVLYVREQTPESETCSKTTFPEPLDPGAARLENCRPDPVSTFTLILRPKKFQRVVMVNSRRTAAGRWKNGTSHGAPVYASFEASDRGRLETLRQELFGNEVAGRVRAREKSERRRARKLREATEAGSLHEYKAAITQMMMQMRIQFGDKLGSGLSPDVPPDVAALNELLDETLREIGQPVPGQYPNDPPGPGKSRETEDDNSER